MARLLMAVLPLSTALTWSRCEQEGTFEFALTALSATSEPVVPGQRLCIEWEASPKIALDQAAGVTLQVEHNFSTGGFREIGVCDSLHGDPKCPVPANQKIAGSVCSMGRKPYYCRSLVTNLVICWHRLPAGALVSTSADSSMRRAIHDVSARNCWFDCHGLTGCGSHRRVCVLES